MEVYSMSATRTKTSCCGCLNEFYLRGCSKGLEGCIPYILKCGHSACEKCIMSFVMKKKALICNICKDQCVLTDDDLQYIKDKKELIKMFPINFSILGMMYYNLQEGRPPVEYVNGLSTDVLENLIIPETAKTFQGDEKYFIGVKCDEHPDNVLDIYCNDCSKNICFSCMITNSCRNHNVIQKKKKDTEKEKQLIEMKSQIASILSRVNQTRSDVENAIIQEPTSGNIFMLKNKIVQHFGKLHAAVQSNEFRIIDSLSKYEDELYGLKKMRQLLLTSEREIIEIIKAIDMSTNPKYSAQMDFELILNLAKDVLNTPWYLSKEDVSTPDGVILNHDVLDHINDYCKIPEMPIDQYKLLSTSELPSGTILLSRSNSNGSESNNYNTSKNELYLKKATSKNNVAEDGIKDIVKGSVEKVYVTHINSPQDFYIQRMVQQSVLDKMTRSLEESNPMCSLTDADITPGKMFITLNEKRREWYRISVIGMIIHKEENGVTESVVMVKFVDYGHVGEVAIKSMASIDSVNSVIPPLAIHCMLVDCNPIDGNWTPSDNVLMLRIVNSKCCILKVIRIMDFTLEVDLTTYSNNYEDNTFSISEALIFHGRAKVIATEDKVNRINNFIRTDISYINKPVLHSKEEVLISDVINPNLFYVQRIKSKETFNKLSDDLNKHYNIKKDVGSIFTPKRGMIVACYSESFKWRRGRVEEIQNPQKIKIYLVDSGNRITVQWSALRKLESKFLKTDELAIKCSLHGIKAKKNKWAVEATDFLILCAKGKVKVIEKISKNFGYKIILNSYVGDRLISVNEEMVTRGYADLSETKPNSWQPKILARPKPADDPITDKTDQNEVDNKLYVKILSANNPTNLFVTILSNEEELDNLNYGLQEHYNNSTPNPDAKWNVDDKCAIFSKKSKAWYRAAIMSIDETNNTAKVFLKDQGVSENVPLENLRELFEKFLSVRNGAIRCHLTGILPAGDNWPNITCEFLQDIVKKFKKFHIIKDGPIADKSLPIKLWVYHKTEGGALDPIITKWRNVSDMIIEQGLAIRDCTKDISTENIPETTNVVSRLPSPPPLVKKILNIGSSNGITIPEIVPDIKHKIVTSWLPPTMPEVADITGIPTYIDDSMNVFIHVPTLPTSQLDDIANNLASIFDNSTPQANDIFWYPGQPCIVQWHVDSKFYRGKVLEIQSNNNVSVIFIDYGNTETCPISTLRKNVVMAEIPIQALKCRIAGVKPKGEKWEESVVDYVHATIVEQSCKIRLLGKGEDGAIYIKLKVNGLINIVDLLLTQDYGEYDDYPKLTPVVEPIEDVKNDDTSDPDIVIDDLSIVK